MPSFPMMFRTITPWTSMAVARTRPRLAGGWQGRRQGEACCLRAGLN
jgi:hypothetical protein